jgi:hypothetical protein
MYFSQRPSIRVSAIIDRGIRWLNASVHSYSVKAVPTDGKSPSLVKYGILPGLYRHYKPGEVYEVSQKLQSASCYIEDSPHVITIQRIFHMCVL